MKLSEAKSDLKPLEVAFDSGAVLNITYRVPEYTPYELAAVTDNKNPDATRIIGMVLKVVDSWDLTDDDGQDIPLTTDGIGNNVGTHILTRIMTAIQKDQMPGEAGEASAAG